MQLFAGSYQRRQEWIAATQANAAAVAMGMATRQPTATAGPPRQRQDSTMVQSATGKKYRAVDPFEMMRIANRI